MSHTHREQERRHDREDMSYRYQKADLTLRQLSV